MRTSRLTLAALFCTGISVSCAIADDETTLGQADQPAVEVNLGVLDDVLSLEPSDDYQPSIDTPTIETTDSNQPAKVPPLPDEAPSIRTAKVPPLPEQPPQRAIVEVIETAELIVEPTVVEELVIEEPAVEEPVVEEPVVEEPVVEEPMIEEPVIEEAILLTDAPAFEPFPEDEDDPFAEIQQMLDNAEEASAVEVPEPETTVEETVVANLPQTPEAEPAETLQIVFEPGIEGISDRDKSALDTLAADLVGDEAQRIQLQAYASSEDGTASMARRLALSRALEVRKYLIDSGVRSTRIDVRALGSAADEGPLDRIDIVLVER